MPAVARARDLVLSPDGFGRKCAFPGTVPISIGNTVNVFVNGLPVPVIGQPVPVHLRGGCSLDTSVLTKASTTVFIGGLGAARIGDLYADNVIISGSENVFIGT